MLSTLSRLHKNSLWKRKSASNENIHMRDILISPIVSFVNLSFDFLLLHIYYSLSRRLIFSSERLFHLPTSFLHILGQGPKHIRSIFLRLVTVDIPSAHDRIGYVLCTIPRTIIRTNVHHTYNAASYLQYRIIPTIPQHTYIANHGGDRRGLGM